VVNLELASLFDESNPSPQGAAEAKAPSASPGKSIFSHAPLPGESEADFRALAENAIEAIFIVNREGVSSTSTRAPATCWVITARSCWGSLL